MFLELVVNFCILFTFAILSYWPFQDQSRFRIPFKDSHPWMIGFLAGITGILLMHSSIHLNGEIIVDSRGVMIVTSGIFGGPIAPIVSSIMIGLSRICMNGITETSVIAGGNIILSGIIIGLLTIKFPMTFKNSKYYFFLNIIQVCLALAYLSDWSMDGVESILYFVPFSLLAFFIVLIVLFELNKHFEKMRSIEKYSETDYLTNLYNSRKFEKVISETLSGNQPFSLLQLDIDFFKKINDSYGHSIGDEILKDFGNRLKKIAKDEGAVAARIGGEEFQILLFNSAPAQGLHFAETIRALMEENPFYTSYELPISITISIGVSSYPDNGATYKNLSREADRALYRAKSTGRNRVVHINTNQA